MTTISSQQLLEHLNNDQTLILDLRSSDSYNGWRLSGEKRPGHIAGAYNLPDPKEIPSIFHSRPWENVILYGTEADLIRETANLFVTNNSTKIFIYEDFYSQWAKEAIYPMENLPGYKNLIPTEILSEIMQRPDKAQIFHCHYDNREPYKKAHIPGARELDTLWLESPEDWKIRSDSELLELAENLGLHKETPVILYGESKTPIGSGQIGAFRCAFILMYMGMKNVSVLNGGFDKWLEEGRPVDSGDDIFSKCFGSDLSASEFLRDYVSLYKEIEDIQFQDKSQLLSIRSKEEFDGVTSGYPYIDQKGHIPGAIFSDCGDNAQNMDKYRNKDQTMKDYKELLNNWFDSGLLKNKKTIFSCGTGWRAAEAWFYAWLTGWKLISLYDGGWYEWSRTKIPAINQFLT